MKMVCMSCIKGEQLRDALEKHGETELAAWLTNAMASKGTPVTVGPTEQPRLGPREVTILDPEEHG